jgi:hypothetical protein
MSYIINNSRGQVIAVVADGTVNTTATDLTLVGRGLTDYGTYENENYVYLLENFANSSAPLQPVLGQLWYDSATDLLSVYDGTNNWAALANHDYVQAQKVSPIFTGVPQAPTPPSGTANTQIATTAFVTNSVQLLGTPTAPTATAGTSSTQIATTAFVSQSPQFQGIPIAPTAAQGTETTQLATTQFVTRGPQFSGIPTSPSAGNNDSSFNLATTQFVQNQKVSPVFTGTPAATTANYNDSSTRIATTAFVQGEKFSPAFTGVPTAPTAPISVSNTQIATTRFVNDWTDALPTMSQQNANAVNITGGTISGIAPLAVGDGGTGANIPADARLNLGLGSISTQNANNISISGGSITNAAIGGGSISSLVNPLAIDSGGTGGNTAASARSSLGLGSISTQNANNISISGGTIDGVNPIAITSGGTGAGNAIQARLNLGLGSMAVQNSSAVGITGGTISGLSLLNTANATITSGTITGIVDLAVADGGTGASDPTNARLNLGAAASARQIVVSGGLVGGGTLTNDITIAIATNSNGHGTRYVSTGAPTGGVNGDIWYQI